MKRITVDEWRKAMEETLSLKAEKVPDGWIVIDEIAEKGLLTNGTKCTKTHAREQAGLLIKAGRAERKYFKIFRNSFLRSVYHYRLK